MARLRFWFLLALALIAWAFLIAGLTQPALPSHEVEPERWYRVG